MVLRKLDPKEHGKTRLLWEKVFPEDTGKFLDYYYFVKARDNEIYVVEEDENIRSMLQLNPYLLQVEEEQFLCHYIIAVGTEAPYRKRGYMRQLLYSAMEDMYRRKEPFTFLMPAAEAIYTPFDFRFIYRQPVAEPEGDRGEMKVELRDAKFTDAEEMAAFFAGNFARDYQVYAVRDGSYYQTMILEYGSENGGICLMEDDGAICGMFFYAREGKLEIREPLYLPGYRGEFLKAVRRLCGDGKVPAVVYSCEGSLSKDRKPLIMARILHLESLLGAMKVKPGMKIACSFAVIDPILVKNSRVWRIETDGRSENLCVRETEDSEGVLPIAALTSLLFGYRTIEEIRKEEGIILTSHLEQELKKLRTLSRVFLNEIV